MKTKTRTLKTERAVFVGRNHPNLCYGMTGDFSPNSNTFIQDSEYLSGVNSLYKINRKDIWLDQDGYSDLSYQK